MAIPAELRQRIARLEGFENRIQHNHVLPLGLPEIDDHLPWRGLPLGALHEVLGDHSAAAFSAALLARTQQHHHQPAVWIGTEESLYGPGLAAFGLHLPELLVVLATNPTDILWAAEEALREGGVGAVVAEIGDLDLTASRRLQLAAETGMTLGLAIRPASKTTTASLTRWQIKTAPSGYAMPLHTVGPPRWSVQLERCRGGKPRTWQLEWCDATGGLTMAAPLPDRPAMPAAGSGPRTASLALAG